MLIYNHNKEMATNAFIENKNSGNYGKEWNFNI